MQYFCHNEKKVIQKYNLLAQSVKQWKFAFNGEDCYKSHNFIGDFLISMIVSYYFKYSMLIHLIASWFVAGFKIKTISEAKCSFW